MKLVFAGTPDFAVPTLAALHTAGHDIRAVFTQPDRPSGRGRKLKASAVADAAISLGLRVEKPARLDPAAQARLRALAPEAIIVVAYGLLLPQAVLDIPPLGCINIHASLLPRWRGAAPIARAIEAGDTQTGVCIMRMDAGLDTGPVLTRATWQIPPDANAADAHDALAALGAEQCVQSLPELANGHIQPQAQSEAGACYARKLNKAEARLDWSQPADVLARKIRAFNPAPVAWTLLDGERIRIWRAQTQASDTTAAAGTVIAADEHGLQVATGDGTLLITQLQKPGGRAQPAHQLLHAWNPLGRRFD
ncbi:MAG: methionyl-tRNA formyltransferase [Sinobacteraceae bacterium]|nr:methionyl-tRNA formyltransferase [Nevskiaceae bacterium]